MPQDDEELHEQFQLVRSYDADSASEGQSTILAIMAIAMLIWFLWGVLGKHDSEY